MRDLEDMLAFKPLQTSLEQRCERVVVNALESLVAKYRELSRLFCGRPELPPGITPFTTARVNMQTRVADVVDVDRQLRDASREIRRYAFMASFDILVSDGSGPPLFAVEADGPSHDTARGRRRDELKDHLCEIAMLPLLRLSPGEIAWAEQRPDEFASAFLSWWSAKRSERDEFVSLMIDVERDRREVVAALEADRAWLLGIPGAYDDSPDGPFADA